MPRKLTANAQQQRSGRSSRTQNTTKFPINYHTNLPCLRLYRRRQTSLALKAHRALNPKQARRSELLSRALCCAQAGRQRTQNTTKFPINYHTNLPCLRLYRRRQTSLALKAHRAFNPKQARRSELLSRAQCCAKAGRRAHRNSAITIGKHSIAPTR